MRALGLVMRASVAVACSSSSSNGGSSIVGEWQYMGYAYWFNADGTCGESVTAGGQPACTTNCTYSLSGNTLTISEGSPGGATTTSTATVTISGGTMTLKGPTYGGTSTSPETFTRVNSSGSNSCPDGGIVPPPPPDAFVQATVGPGTQNPAACPLGGSPTAWLDLGTPIASKPTTVQNGSSTVGGTANVACTVHASVSGFDVSLDASVPGAQGGSISITSPAGQGAVTTGGGTGLTATFTSAQHGAYTANGCTLSFMYQGAQVPVTPEVAAGRIWGHVSCPHAQMGSSSCDAEADFLFEQCTQ